MRAIIIGAGRGSRLMPTTADSPKCFAQIADRAILDWTIEAFQANGVTDICFIGGYQIDKVKQTYPQFTFRHNQDWQNNNILASLFCAQDLMDGPFICCYSDILFNAEIIRRVLDHGQDVVVGVDTDWLVRYRDRTEHPSDDAEKVAVDNGRVERIHRGLSETESQGEFIGVAGFSSAGAAILKKHYLCCQQEFAGKPWRGAKQFEKAYFILLLQEMIERGEHISYVDTPGGYIEVDTQQDFEYARQYWLSRHYEK